MPMLLRAVQFNFTRCSSVLEFIGLRLRLPFKALYFSGLTVGEIVEKFLA